MDSRYLALQDAEHARDLRPTWSKAHYRIGQAHVALGEYEKAVHSFDKALALDPTNAETKNARDFALDKKHYYDRQDHLVPQNMPRTTREQLDELSKNCGYSAEHQEKFIEFIRKNDPGKDAVFTAHQYRDGDDNIKQDYELATRFYSKAAALGNAEGMYNLALLHRQGLGVQKDIQAAIKLLEKAAAQNPSMSDKLLIPNVGVAEAEHALGLHYATGVGVEMNHRKAAEWYQRASDHGSANAANNLGLMYGDGEGVEKDLVGNQNNYFDYQLRKGDYQAAEQWCDHAIENNNILDAHAIKIIRDKAEEERALFKDLDIEIWEKQNSLSVTNLTYNERIQRKICADEPSATRTSNAVQDLAKTFQLLKPVGQPFGGKSRTYDRTMLEEYSQKGYIFARRLLEAQTYFLRAMHIFLNDNISVDNRNIQFIKEFSASIRIQHIVIQLSEPLRHEIKLAVDCVLVQCESKQSQLDEDARVCFGFLHMNSLQSTVEFLTVCIQMYPKSPFFLELRGSLYGFMQKYDEGLADFNAALQLVPADEEFLYDRAAMLRLIKHCDLNETVVAYDKFAKSAPFDHRKLPEAYYAAATCCLANTTMENHVELTEKYYEKGIEAEKNQLPCFLPYESNNKLLISKLLSLKSVASNKTPVESIVVARKPKSRLTDPRRLGLMQRHRDAIAETGKLPPNQKLLNSTNKPRLYQNSPSSLVGLKGVTLREMNPIKDHVYQGYVLSGVIFERSPVVEPSIWLLFEDENERYVNYHSINCQVACDHNLMIRSTIVRWPGSTHDAFILGQSSIAASLSNGIYGDGWLLGDSGYPLRAWLLTPFNDPTTAAQRRYNRALKSARSTIERAFGVLKARFCCLDRSGGGLQFTPERCVKIILSCMYLRNLARRLQLEDDDEEKIRQILLDEFDDGVNTQEVPTGTRVRDSVVQNYFSK
ncbi:unnamed protein product [Didymodactylos carnosus]|uniref:DDE Tnp4 domain-containing protein n=1 Tax=Didymodactylos carnosus TaxID=1234261 RepID=A0A8S2PBV9_9BILA|nr:unnamed protein product [Didymodactylos carnosus]CAF4047134.1 unnamed protein product [Didymodactylos carnosus]